MTALRQRLIDDLHLRGYAERTVETYVAIVARLAQHFRAAPDQLLRLDQLALPIVGIVSEFHDSFELMRLETFAGVSWLADFA